jgi:hypothetical protein
MGRRRGQVVDVPTATTIKFTFTPRRAITRAACLLFVALFVKNALFLRTEAFVT